MGADTPAALKGVSRLPQATTLTINHARQSLRHCYWRPAALLETARLGPADVAERFAELLARAVARCLTGGDAVSLSGGLHPPALAAGRPPPAPPPPPPPPR